MSTDKTLADVQPGGMVSLGSGWTGWATQYPGKMPKLYGAREIAEVNHHPEEGQRLIFLSENPVHVGNLVDAARTALPFVAFAYSKGMDGAEEVGRAIEAALSAQPSPGGRRFNHVSQVAKHFGMAVTPEEMGEAIANAPSSGLSSESAAAAFAYAQPSPGGQDALELLEAYDQAVEDLSVERSEGWNQDNRRPQLEADVAELRAELIGALAARQPVGEPVAWMTHHDEPMLFPAAAEAAAYCEDDELPVPLFRQPAQAVDLGQLPHGIRLVEIPRRNGLDPINVFVQDYELGRGRIVVTCYGQAWCGFWGAMGDRTVMQFVAACDADYVAGNMLSGRHEHVKKHERTYVERIAAEVIDEFRALIGLQAVGK
ncbi:TPA: hypothetical protein QEL15_004117 [Stenotrophomonas maltophilia]|nr:hypothetical protein [Stenotrophomonas maltophilia]